jgi:hypothetical protein
LLPHFSPIAGIKRIELNLKQTGEKISSLFTATLAVELAGPSCMPEILAISERR